MTGADDAGGALFAAVAKATGLGAPQCRDAMEGLCAAIASALKAKAQSDADLHESLLDLLEDNGEDFSLDDPDDLTSAEAIADGEAILADVYGSREAALAALLGPAGSIGGAPLAKLAAISATSVVAALAQPVPAAMPLAGAQQAVSGGGIIGILVSSLIKGAVQAAARQLAPKRLRRSYRRYATRRKTKRSTARRAGSVLEDIFAEILGSKRK